MAAGNGVVHGTALEIRLNAVMIPRNYSVTAPDPNHQNRPATPSTAGPAAPASPSPRIVAAPKTVACTADADSIDEPGYGHGV
jgi:hypothetical protein